MHGFSCTERGLRKRDFSQKVKSWLFAAMEKKLKHIDPTGACFSVPQWAPVQESIVAVKELSGRTNILAADFTTFLTKKAVHLCQIYIHMGKDGACHREFTSKVPQGIRGDEVRRLVRYLHRNDLINNDPALASSMAALIATVHVVGGKEYPSLPSVYDLEIEIKRAGGISGCLAKYRQLQRKQSENERDKDKADIAKGVAARAAETREELSQQAADQGISLDDLIREQDDEREAREQVVREALRADKLADIIEKGGEKVSHLRDIGPYQILISDDTGALFRVGREHEFRL